MAGDRRALRGTAPGAQLLWPVHRGGATGRHASGVRDGVFRERIASNPANRDRLLGMDAQRFIDVMAHWREYFLRDADLPVIGASAAALGSITVPTCVIPGNDRTHPRRVGENASRLLPNSEFHILMPQDSEDDVSTAGWDEKQGELASIFIDFLKRVSVASPV